MHFLRLPQSSSTCNHNVMPCKQQGTAAAGCRRLNCRWLMARGHNRCWLEAAASASLTSTQTSRQLTAAGRGSCWPSWRGCGRPACCRAACAAPCCWRPAGGRWGKSRSWAKSGPAAAARTCKPATSCKPPPHSADRLPHCHLQRAERRCTAISCKSKRGGASPDSRGPPGRCARP